MAASTSQTTAAGARTVGPLIVLYSVKFVAVHRGASVAETSAKTRLFELERSPENDEFCRSVAALAKTGGA